MTVGQVLKKYFSIEVDLLLAFVLNKPKEFILAHPEIELSQTVSKRLLRLIKRRKTGEPIAYLQQKKNFFGENFFVNKHVLIPRPETELLVEMVLQYLEQKKQPRKILDMGTGSGCIAIILAKQYPNLTISASDISKKSLMVAKKNALDLGVKIKFYHSDLFAKIHSKFDCIIANLPYVKYSEYIKSDTIHFEPRIALTDGSENWKIYDKFFSQIKTHILSGAKIFLEIDPGSKEVLKKSLKKYLPKQTITFLKDYSGKYRFCIIKTP